jgi:hypothetical protein
MTEADIGALALEYGPKVFGAGGLVLAGRWLLRAQAIGAWIRLAGFVVIGFGLAMLAGIVEVNPGRAVELFETIRGFVEGSI